MTTTKHHGGNVLPVIGGLLFAVWIFGAFVAGMYYNYAQKKQCIQDEGWLKGWLWCSIETNYSFGANMLRGAIWPIELFFTASNETKPSNGGSSAKPTVDQPQKLTITQRATITERCAEVAATNKRRYPDIPGPSAELCVMSHSRAALDGRPSFLTMTPSDYEHYVNSRDLTPEEAETMLKSYDGFVKTCSRVAIKTMMVQPLIKKKSKEAIDPKDMAVLVADWEPKIPDTNLIHHAALASHFRDYGLYGTTLAYFLDEFDRCVSLSTAVFGLLREMDARSEQVMQTTNKYRAEVADMFQTSQGLRDQVYGKEQ